MINGISPAMSKDLNTAVNKFEIQKFTYASDKHSRKNLTGALQYKGERQKQFSDYHIYLKLRIVLCQNNLHISIIKLLMLFRVPL